MIPRTCFQALHTVYIQFCYMLARSDTYFILQLLLIIITTTCISLSLRRTSAPIYLTIVLGVLGTQETFCIVIVGLFERDSFDLFLPEFDKPWVIHLRETCCCLQTSALGGPTLSTRTDACVDIMAYSLVGGGWPVRLKVVDLGFLFCKDGDLSDAGLSWSGRSGEFRKALPANVTVNLCLEFAGSSGIRSWAPMLLFRPFGSGGSDAKLCSLLPSADFWSMVMLETENIMKAGLED
jgi:hypothetical protein